MNAHLGESRLLPPGSSPSAGQPAKATPSPVNADEPTENQDTDENGVGNLYPATTAHKGLLTASGTIDGGGFDVEVASVNPTGWTDKDLEGGDRR